MDHLWNTAFAACVMVGGLGAMVCLFVLTDVPWRAMRRGFAGRVLVGGLGCLALLAAGAVGFNHLEAAGRKPPAFVEPGDLLKRSWRLICPDEGGCAARAGQIAQCARLAAGVAQPADGDARRLFEACLNEQGMRIEACVLSERNCSILGTVVPYHAPWNALLADAAEDS